MNSKQGRLKMDELIEETVIKDFGKYYVYKTTNKVNGKIYVGVHKSENIEKDSYLGSGYILKEAIEKYGKENFERKILFEFDNSVDAFNKEKEIVNEEFVDRDDTYNTALGGFGGRTTKVNPFFGKHHTEESKQKWRESREGYTHSEETRKKISESGKRRFENMSDEEWEEYLSRVPRGPDNPNYGKIMSEEQKLKISEANTGRVASEETRKLMSEMRKGVPKSEEHKKKISESNMGKKCPHNQITNKNPEKIRKTAEKHTGMKRSPEACENISKSLIGKKKGKESNSFVGLWHTPFGTFDNLDSAKEVTNNAIACIRDRCMNNKKTVKTFSINKDPKLSKEDFGKTWKELGWWLEKINKGGS